MFGIVLLIISVCLREIEYATCADPLEYWHRYPTYSYDVRRATSMNVHIKGKTKNVTYYKIGNFYQYEKPNKFIAVQKKVNIKQKTTSVHFDSKLPTTRTLSWGNGAAWPSLKILKETQRYEKPNTFVAEQKKVKYFQKTTSIYADLKLRTTPTQSWGSGAAWPRVRSKLKETYRYTRITPQYLIQTPSPNKTSLRNSISDDDKYISPYNQKSLLEQIIEDIRDVYISLEIIGRTAEYNDIILLKATRSKSETFFRAEDSKYADEEHEKKIIFIVHGLSVKGMRLLSCLHEVDKFRALLNIYFKHLDKFDIFIIPMANPDGFANKKNNIWDKNMSLQNACQGVNLDRNFDVAWNGTATNSSCSQQYPGPRPFSEPETRAIRDVFQRYSQKIIAYINVHASSFIVDTKKGDAVLYPKGYSDEQTDDDHYIDLKGDIEEAMKNASFQVVSVEVDTLYNWYGMVNGTSVDYASTVYGIPYAMEFVMQQYVDDDLPGEDLELVALQEIWKRVIDATFKNICRSINHEET